MCEPAPKCIICGERAVPRQTCKPPYFNGRDMVDHILDEGHELGCPFCSRLLAACMKRPCRNRFKARGNRCGSVAHS